MVVNDAGGISAAMDAISSSENTEGLLGREGNYTLLIWVSTMVLWLFADPMFPQLYQRLCAAESDAAPAVSDVAAAAESAAAATESNAAAESDVAAAESNGAHFHRILLDVFVRRLVARSL